MDPPTVKLAHDLFDAWAWVYWVSVQRTDKRFVIKVKHTYPINVRDDLRRWIGGQNFAHDVVCELQIKGPR